MADHNINTRLDALMIGSCRSMQRVIRSIQGEMQWSLLLLRGSNAVQRCYAVRHVTKPTSASAKSIDEQVVSVADAGLLSHTGRSKPDVAQSSVCADQLLLCSCLSRGQQYTIPELNRMQLPTHTIASLPPRPLLNSHSPTQRSLTALFPSLCHSL